jgi:hypothetical protein
MLDQEGSFEANQPQEIMPDLVPRGDTLTPEKLVFHTLKLKASGPGTLQ